MPKRRRLLTPSKSKRTPIAVNEENDFKIKEVSAARGRLKGALLEVLDPASEYSDSSDEQKDRNNSRRDSVETDSRRKSPVRQSYVLKLFDRSVDLSQFNEDSPLYPICRAWMINQPKANYREIGQSFEEPEPTENSVELPGPDGPPVRRIPELLPEQKERSKDNINLNYRDSALPTREQLLRGHLARWVGVRSAWLERALLAEARYHSTQLLLNTISVNSL